MLRYQEKKKITWNQISNDITNFYAPKIPYQYFVKKKNSPEKQNHDELPLKT